MFLRSRLAVPCLSILILIGACEPQEEELSGSPMQAANGSQDLDGSMAISGRFPDWMKGSSYVVQALAVRSGAYTALAAGPVDAQGTFSLTLPGAEVMRQYAPLAWLGSIPCTSGGMGSITASPDPLTGVMVTFRLVRANVSKPTGPRSDSSSSDGQGLIMESTEALYVFSPASSSAEGNMTCTENGSSTQTRVSVILVPGWNALLKGTRTVLQTGQPAQATLTLRSGAAPAGLAWDD
jgi:hypothetical protein